MCNSNHTADQIARVLQACSKSIKRGRPSRLFIIYASGLKASWRVRKGERAAAARVAPRQALRFVCVKAVSTDVLS